MRREPLRGWAAWRGWAGALAVLVIAGQTAWRAVLLSRAYFTQDDYLMLSRSVGRSLSWDFLMQDYSGHLFPGGFVFAWFHANHTPLDWGASIVPLVVMQLAASVVMWLVLSRIVGDSPVRVPILAFFCYCPLTIWSVQWWAVAIQFLPVTLAVVGAAWFFLRWIQDGSRWSAVMALLMMPVALLFQERGVLIPILLAGMAICLQPPSGGLRRVVGAVRTSWLLWLGAAVIGGGYLVLHRELAPITTESAGTTTGSLALAGNVLGRNALPGLWGGPWTGEVVSDAIVRPAWLSVVVAAVLTVALVAGTVRRGGRDAGWAWLGFAVLALANVGLLFGGRTHLGADFGLVPRYAADLVPPAATALAFVAAAPRRSTPVDPSRRRVLRAALVAAGYAVSAAVTTTWVAPHTFNPVDRSFVAAVRADLRAHPGAVLFDGGVPNDMMVIWFADDARLSTVLATAPEHPVFDAPTSSLLMADPSGHLRPVALLATTQAEDPEDLVCGYHVTATPTPIRLTEGVDDQPRVIRIGYYTDVEATATLRVDDRTSTFDVKPGLQSVDIVVRQAFDGVELSIDNQTATLCVPALTVGSPTPLMP